MQKLIKEGDFSGLGTHCITHVDFVTHQIKIGILFFVLQMKHFTLRGTTYYLFYFLIYTIKLQHFNKLNFDYDMYLKIQFPEVILLSQLYFIIFFNIVNKQAEPSLGPTSCSLYTDSPCILLKILVFSSPYLKIVLTSLRVFSFRPDI